MYIDILNELESSLVSRNPALVSLLKPGLSESRIRRKLKQAGIDGYVEPIISLYMWHDGNQGKPCITMEEVSLFPGKPYCLVSLDMAIIHYKGFLELAAQHSPYRKVAGCHFPLFWDGSLDFITIDFSSKTEDVFVLEDSAPELLRIAYPSFEAFLKDGVASNRENRSLKCFL